MTFTGPSYPTATDTVANGGFFTERAIGVTGALPPGSTLADAFDTALNWSVEYDVAVNGTTLEQVPNLKLLRRSDTNEVIGWGKDGFTAIQNADQRAILEGGLADTEYEVGAALSLRGGRRTAVIIALKDAGLINVDGDKILPFLALSNSNDGSSALRLMPLYFRPGCTNMLGIFWSRQGAREAVTAVRHTRNAERAFADVKAAIRRFTSVRDEFQAEVERMIRTEVTAAQRDAFFDIVAPLPKPEDDASKSKVTRAENRREAIVETYLNDPRVGFYGTAWGLLQSVSTFEQNDSGFRLTVNGPRNRSERKVERALDGSKTESRAYVALERALATA